MNHRLILPATPRGRWMLVLFLSVIVAGLWPVVLLANHAIIVLGLPLIAVWSCLIIIASSGVMLLANRLLPLPDAMLRDQDPVLPKAEETESAADE